MKIYRKMYNRETKDCELIVEFNDKEYDLIKGKGFIQEEYICSTYISSMLSVPNLNVTGSVTPPVCTAKSWAVLQLNWFSLDSHTGMPS